MRFLSVCSGIEAASVAWAPLGWKAAAFSEIDAFPSAVLAHHYPDVPNLGDMTRYLEWPDLGPVDLVCGGTPCQAFSVAGLRAGLADPRGNLALTFLAIVDRYRPRWIVWENVPGVLSSNGGRDFAAFLGGLGQLGYGWSFRVLDAQWCRIHGFPRAVPQRRRRVFVVGYLGDWRRAAAVLFEPESVLGDTPPRREAGKGVTTYSPGSIGSYSENEDGVAGTIRAMGGAGSETIAAFGGGNTSGPIGAAACLTAKGHRSDFEVETFVASALTASRSSTQCPNEDTTLVAHTLTNAASKGATEDGTGRGTPIVPVAFDAVQITSKANRSIPQPVSPTMAKASSMHAVIGYAVRRLTPLECSRLMGFPDDYLSSVTWRGKCPPPDGPMYKALGNSWAVNVARWVGYRIQMVEDIAAELRSLEAAE